VYYGADSDYLKAFSITDAKLSISAASSTAFAYPGTTPSVSANGTSDGIVWAVENSNGAGVLHAYDAGDVAKELYNSDQAADGRDHFTDNKFITPTIANGKVYVGTPTGVIIFGLFTATAVKASLNPTVFGQSVTFTATVSSKAEGTITGTVSFKDGTTVLGSGTVSDGKATFSTSALAVGGHSITAEYSGNTSYGSSASAALAHTVNKASTTAKLTSSLNPSTVGKTVTFKATIATTAPGTGTPTGTVTFNDGATTLGSVALDSGTASYTTTKLARASHSITAVYSGSKDNLGATSAVLTQKVD
jgi:hypothetical protein